VTATGGGTWFLTPWPDKLSRAAVFSFHLAKRLKMIFSFIARRRLRNAGFRYASAPGIQILLIGCYKNNNLSLNYCTIEKQAAGL